MDGGIYCNSFFFFLFVNFSYFLCKYLTTVYSLQSKKKKKKVNFFSAYKLKRNLGGGGANEIIRAKLPLVPPPPMAMGLIKHEAV